MKNEKILLASLGFILIGILLASRPNCARGCKTLAEHLIQHGLDDLIAGLLA